MTTKKITRETKPTPAATGRRSRRPLPGMHRVQRRKQEEAARLNSAAAPQNVTDPVQGESFDERAQQGMSATKEVPNEPEEAVPGESVDESTLRGM